MTITMQAQASQSSVTAHGLCCRVFTALFCTVSSSQLSPFACMGGGSGARPPGVASSNTRRSRMHVCIWQLLLSLWWLQCLSNVILLYMCCPVGLASGCCFSSFALPHLPMCVWLTCLVSLPQPGHRAPASGPQPLPRNSTAQHSTPLLQHSSSAATALPPCQLLMPCRVMHSARRRYVA